MKFRTERENTHTERDTETERERHGRNQPTDRDTDEPTNRKTAVLTGASSSWRAVCVLGGGGRWRLDGPVLGSWV